MRRVEWRELALEDREAILDFIALDNIDEALRLNEHIEDKARLAAKTPTLYRAGRMKGTREAVVRPNYILVYQVEPDAGVVLRVLQATQQWPPGKR